MLVGGGTTDKLVGSAPMVALLVAYFAGSLLSKVGYHNERLTQY